MKNYKLLTFLFLSILVCISCKKEKLNYSPEANFLIEGVVTDSVGNLLKNVEVQLISLNPNNDGYSHWLGGSAPFWVEKSVRTDTDGYYSMVFSKGTLANWNDGLVISFQRTNTISPNYYEEESVNISIDLTDNKLVLDKAIKTGGYLTLTHYDDPDIDYDTETYFTIEVNIEQSSYSKNESLRYFDHFLIKDNILVLDEVPLIVNWSIQKGSSIIYHSQSDTLYLSAEEKLLHSLKY